MAMMNNKKKKKEPEKKKPYQGSIVIVRHEMFNEKTRTDRTFWRYEMPNEEGVIEGDMQPSCCDLNLRQLFKSVGMEDPVTKKSKEEKITLTKKRPAGLWGIDSMEEHGENRIKLCISGNTQTDIDNKLSSIHDFCNKNNIPYEDFCLFICVTSGKQKELTDDYMKKMDKLRKSGE